MMRSLFSGVSGLKGHQTRMDVIGNNIANVNTTGFKSSRVTFADTLNQTQSGASAPTDTLGGTNPKQIGLGTGVASIDMLFTDGSVQSTGKNTDLCLSGNGLFVVKSGSETYYTRDGAFEFDAAGNYVLPGNGMFVQGQMYVDGVLTDKVSNIKIPAGKGMDATKTSLATYSQNLKADLTGYNISNLIVSYADGTSETASSYNPVSASEGTITLTTTTGSYVVDDTADFTFTTNDVFTDPVTTTNASGVTTIISGKKIWTSKVESVTADTAGTIDITIGNTSKTPVIVSVGGNTSSTATLPGLTSGTYALGDMQKLGGTVVTNGVTAIGPMGDPVQITFTVAGTGTSLDGQNVTVQIPKPENGTYYDGQNVEFEFELQSYQANVGAKINCTNGRTDTAQETIQRDSKTKDNDYLCYANQTYGTITQITRDSDGNLVYYNNNKKVNSVSVVADDGTTLTGLMGKSYKAGEVFYPSITTTVNIYDSQGNNYSVPVLFTKQSGLENTWELSLAGGGDSYTIQNGERVTTINLTKSDLVFDVNGRYSSGTASLTLEYNDPIGTFDPQDVTMNLSSLTQYAGNSTINATANGNAAGTLKSVQIDSTGTITGVYTNGIKRSEAVVSVAQFNNAAGLTKVGSSLYQDSNNSGTANIKTAAALGCTITPSALEMSNVDIANEFSDMIITQRGFQSNSKVITVGDEMLETLINMKR
ncbi:flagellar hook-basal body complex protein [Selenomonas ruminantium]|uniref:Flagellar hook protein FlgE n=1 Tax=Selenomonas ruminantium TaxID=971 RepID=A0A1I0YIY3_SELRU|nr:flagellar hook-basal body complex protein [Selenomonas ruminantium]SFB12298.1 flagellar hook protein FlgE [Selenomonas ruminantium]